MSVTFTFARYIETADHGTVLAHGIDCSHTCPTPTTCDDAMVYGPTCCEHVYDATNACGCEAFDVNVSNANAVAILNRLGLDHDVEYGIIGSATPDDLLGRAMVGNVGRDDSGVADATDGGPGTGYATFVDCGVRAGYYADTLDRIARLATEAAHRGMMVAWA